MMHHRRAASDTTMFKRSMTTELKKEGASSSHSSRSSTPLISLLPRPAGMFVESDYSMYHEVARCCHLLHI